MRFWQKSCKITTLNFRAKNPGFNFKNQHKIAKIHFLNLLFSEFHYWTKNIRLISLSDITGFKCSSSPTTDLCFVTFDFCFDAFKRLVTRKSFCWHSPQWYWNWQVTQSSYLPLTWPWSYKSCSLRYFLATWSENDEHFWSFLQFAPLTFSGCIVGTK